MATDRTTLPPGTGSARIEDAGTPSRAEIQQRVSALYDRAESDTGTFNATRARSGRGGRRTVTSVANSGRPAADSSLEAVTRQWFEMARSRVGPTTPAKLPAVPDRPALAARPRSTPELPSGGGAGQEPEAGGRPAPELTGRAVAALPAAIEAPPREPRALMPAPASASLSTSAPASAPAAPQAFLRSGKEKIGRKLAAAREVLARAVPQATPSLPAIESWPVEQTWDTGPQQAYRPETDTWAGQQVHRPETDTWAGQHADTGSTALASTGQNAVLAMAGTGFPLPTPDSGLLSYDSPAPTTGFAVSSYDFPAPTSDFAVPQPPITPPSNAFPEPENGLLAASYGDLLAPTAGIAAPAVPPQPVHATLPTPEPAFTMTEFPLPAPELGLPLPEFTLPTAPAPVPAPAPLGLTTHATGAGYLGKADKALAFARAQIGRPCVTGATGPESYDCASLTQAAWRAAGVTLPRTALDQARAFSRVTLEDLRPGDLVFFFDDLSHTGLCTGNGMMIHAPGPGAAIREESVHALGEGALRGAVRPA
ncbi:NlpC/P60 family protein [Streptomyces phaeoluteigriseus]|uniref:NlpC/P60 family protein n=1 Tax=Streptomyces phaeoluteigriseus TaxID=114686 RepID=A0ABY4Z7D1_9ACTN|nr:NlpC/P60 family protein [Streptomyces phaeoluteigriseus]USQ84959.1 NlpC/P60 family protein [Streptomyces phaeoluteigriseus]